MDTIVRKEDVLAYLGIDYADEMIERNVERLIAAADAYLRGSIGENYPMEDPRAKELALIIIADLYDNRSVSASVTSTTRKIVNDFSAQLRLELRKGGGGENGKNLR